MSQYSFDLGDISPTKYFASVSVLLALLFALIENSNDLAFGVNLVLWLFQSIGPMLLMVVSYKLGMSFRRFNQLNPWFRLFLAGCVGAFVFVPFALCVDLLLGNDPLPQGRSEILYALADEAAGVMPPVVLCWLAINAPWQLGFKVVKIQTETTAVEVPADKPFMAEQASPLLALLPESKRGQILYLKSELHYLMVVTTAGQALILSNLKDAILACDGLVGMQPHRSYWVNKAAVQEFRRQGREGILVLVNQEEIPVSRNKVSEMTAFLAKPITAE